MSRIILIMLTTIVMTVHATDSQEREIHIHTHINNYASNEQSMHSDITQSSSHTTTTINSLVNKTADTAKEYGNGVLSWITNNKKKTVLYCLLSGYAYVWYKLIRLNYALSHSANWSRWQRTLSLQDLLAQPQSQIATNLLTAIQRTYTTPDTFDDFISPLVAFVRDVDTELAQLEQLVTLHRWIGRLYLSYLFPKQEALLAQAQENIHRLTYLKNMLLNWISEQKVATQLAGTSKHTLS